MGLATGEAELRGADYFGAVLNRAARVMAAGHGSCSPTAANGSTCAAPWTLCANGSIFVAAR
jgi:class 3 adenylate cyclase